MDIDALPRQPRAQIAGSAIHDTQQRRDVVGQLGTATPATRINCRECIQHVDSFADRDDGSQNACKDYRCLRILTGIVRHHKRASIQIQAADSTASSHKADGIGGISVLRSRLSQIFSAIIHMLESFCRRKIEWGRFKSTTAFVCIAFRDTSKYVDGQMQLTHV